MAPAAGPWPSRSMPIGVLPRCSFSPPLDGPEPPESDPPPAPPVVPTLLGGVEYATPSGPCCIAQPPVVATIARMLSALRVRNIRDLLVRPAAAWRIRPRSEN